MDDEATEHENIKEVLKLTSDLHESSKQQPDCFHLFLPKTKHGVLAYDLVIIDSPGIDIDPELDKGISKYCADSDVFLLVISGDGRLSLIEKNFLLKVKDTLSTPNIFILVNRWDLCENHPDANAVKKQHQKYARALLECVYGQEAKHNRVFFVSSKRKLETMLQGEATPESREYTADDFDEFQKTLTNCVTRNAVESRCEERIRSGQSMCVVIQNVLKMMEDYFRKERECCVDLTNKMESLMVTKNNMSVELKEFEQKIRGLVEESFLQENASKLIQNKGPDEKEFDENNVNEYKKTLCARMKLQLGVNIWNYCQQDMNDRQKETEDILKEKVDEVRKILSFDLYFESKSGVAHTNLQNGPITYDNILTGFTSNTGNTINGWICALVAIPSAIVCPLGTAAVMSAGGLSIGGFAMCASTVVGGLTGLGAAVFGQYKTRNKRKIIEAQFVENANKKFETLKTETAKLISKNIAMKLSDELDDVMKHFKGPEIMLANKALEAGNRLKPLEQLIRNAGLKSKRVQKLQLEFQKLTEEAERLKQNQQTVSERNSEESA
ncbi:hypothetical protein DPMN_036081 [Dreissena polymorpha]|uniref:Dynamin N-terminal domain-containing protein n=1 Tax=Dreissena polymorpha TaxID=45954 RepID=A0A9D4MA24_DREPO|nr:hypothetical protein DPMN_036081 [Dreissena polymorpha]